MNTPLLIAIGGFAVIVAIVSIISLNDNQDDLVDSQNTGLIGDVTIGTLLPLTGDMSLQAEERSVATQLAVNDFNDYLKENNANWNLKIVYEDSKADPTTALEKLTTLYEKNITIVSGPSTSGELRNIMDYANSNGMLLFSPASTAASLAIAGDNVYRLTPDDSKQGPALAAMIKFHEINSIIQVVRNDTWGEGLSASIEESFLSDGTNTSQIILYNPESPEYSAIISLLAETVNQEIILHGADNVGVVMIGFAETFQFLESAVSHDVLDDVLWFGSDGSAKEESLVSNSVVASFADTVQYTSTLISTSDNDIHDDVENRIVEQLGRVPNSYAFSVYDIVWILGLAMLESDSSDVDDVTLIIPEIANNYNGAIGNTRLNDAGDLDSSNYDVWEIYNAEWVKIGFYNSDDGSFDDKHNEDIPTKTLLLSDEMKLKEHLKGLVQLSINQYDGDLSSITLQYGEHYTFVLSGNLDTILAHPNIEDVGVYPTGINNGNIPVEELLNLLNTTDGVWLDYTYNNPATGQIEDKRSWLVLSDGYVFGTGYYYNTSDMILVQDMGESP